MAENFRSPWKIARRLKCAPLAITKVKNWPLFLICYSLGLTPKRPYVFRSGARVMIRRAVDHVPLLEIFLRKDYGTPPGASIIVDLGANIGAFAIFATSFARDVVVYAYEPLPEFHADLDANIRLNGRTETVHSFNAAVASTVGTCDLYFSGERCYFPTFVRPSGATLEDRVPVRSTTLAEIVTSNNLQRIDLLKIDCEGAEYEILYSTPEWCLAKIAEIRMEYHNLDQQKRNVRALEQFLRGSGFVVTRMSAGVGNTGNLWAERAGVGREV